MAHPHFAFLMRHIRRLTGVRGSESATDRQLLERFVLQREEAAFATLVERHGPTVLGLCRRMLRDANDADDAFQATFLVLVRRAGAIRNRDSVGSWLYGVAYRVSLEARTRAARRRLRERQGEDMRPTRRSGFQPDTQNDAPDVEAGDRLEAYPTADPAAEADWREIRPVLDDELCRLPEKYRAPVILCYLQGKTNEEAAEQLHCPSGTVKGRLSRARDILRERLGRRGVALSAVALTPLLAANAPAAVPPTLATLTLKSALTLASGKTLASTPAATLAEGVSKAMYRKQLLRFVPVVALLGLLAAGAGLMAYGALAADPKEPAAPAPLPPLVRSAKSGDWSVPATWEGGKVPTAGVRVQVRSGHAVTYDLKSDQVIRSIHVAGTLHFAHDKDTRLDVGLIKVQPGDDPSEDGFDCTAHMTEPDPKMPLPVLEIGTQNQPIDAKHTALIRLTMVDGLDKQSCPAIVCCCGRWDIHGTPLSRTWVKLGADAKKGDSGVTLAESVTGWRVGDRLIVTATKRDYKTLFTEQRTVKSIDGLTLTLDQPLENDHLGTGLYRGEVANLTRNAVVESADPAKERGHTMYHRYSAGGISYAEFRHLGKEGVLGRYSIHYHLVGDTMRGSSIVGASIWDSGNRWVTIHGTNYLVVRDCVGYGSIGHGFFMEDGTEVYNVLDRNLAVNARRGKRLPKQVLPFDANDGAGYWWANSLNTFTRNVSAENAQYGFRYEATRTSSFNLTLPVMQPDGSRKPTDIRTLPFVRFEDNETHSSVGLYGFNLGEGVDRVGPDTRHPFVVRNMLIWDTHYGFRPQAPSLLVENMRLHSTVYGVYHPNYDNHVYRNLTINGDGSEPFNRGHDDISVQYGPLTVDGLTFENVRGPRDTIPLIQMSDDNPTGKASSHFRNVQAVDRHNGSKRALVNTGGGAHITPKTPTGVPVYLLDYFGPGRHAKVEATNAKDFGTDGLKYREEPFLTGHESRVAEVADVEFPKLLDPVDDLPPVTVITHVGKPDKGKLMIRGTCSDNGPVKRVLLNGQEAKSVTANFAEWEIVLDNVKPGELKLQAHAEDAAGNVEKLPHVLTVQVAN